MMMLPRLLCALASGFLAVSNGSVLVEKYGLHNDMILQAVATDYRPSVTPSGIIRLCDYAIADTALSSYEIGWNTPSYELYTEDQQLSVVSYFWYTGAVVNSVVVSTYGAPNVDVDSRTNPLYTAYVPFGLIVDNGGAESYQFFGLLPPNDSNWNGAYEYSYNYKGTSVVSFDATSTSYFSTGRVPFRSRDWLQVVQDWWTSVYDTNIIQSAQSWMADALSDDSYQVGYNDGQSAGYDNGYAVGYQDGVESSTTTEHGIIALFSAVANVPIQVLNGLGGIAVWHTPIVGIIISFLFIAVVAGIIKRFI